MRHSHYDLLRHALNKARRSQGLTRAQVAGRLGRPERFVEGYESGRFVLEVDELMQIAGVLHVDVVAALRRFAAAEHDGMLPRARPVR